MAKTTEVEKSEVAALKKETVSNMQWYVELVAVFEVHSFIFEVAVSNRPYNDIVRL
jgi:hypothetical protein